MNMQNNSRLVAAIDIGSSKIVGILGSMDTDGIVTVLAIETEESGYAIKRGCIHNVEEAANRISRIIDRINFHHLTRQDRSIYQVFVGVGGQSLHTVRCMRRKEFEVDTEITEAHLEALENESLATDFGQYSAFEIISAEHRLDGISEEKPVGLLCKNIEVSHIIVLGRTSIVRNIERCFQRLNIGVAGLITSPLALSRSILTGDERKLGCAQVDCGGNTTTVAVFKRDNLLSLATIPFGGINITRDIMSLNVVEAQAENLKKNSAHALLDRSIENKKIVMTDSMEISQYDLDMVVEARIDEIIENIASVLNENNLINQLPAGITLSGGASQLNGLAEALQRKTDLRVKHGSLIPPLVNRTGDALTNPALAMIVSLLASGKKNCVTEPEIPIAVKEAEARSRQAKAADKQPEPKKRFKMFLDRLVGENDQELQ